jgi:hypothetical protein
VHGSKRSQARAPGEDGPAGTAEWDWESYVDQILLAERGRGEGGGVRFLKTQIDIAEAENYVDQGVRTCLCIRFCGAFFHIEIFCFKLMTLPTLTRSHAHQCYELRHSRQDC